MASINKVILIGHLGKDPEKRTFPNGGAVCNITLATSERWKDKNSGEQKEATEWHRVVFNDRLAEIADEYLQKGSMVYIEGTLRTRKYTDTSGVEKYVTEIRADQMKMLDKRQDGGGQANDQGGGQQRNSAPQQQRQQPARQPQQRQAPRPSSGFDDMDDDIPF